MGRAYGRVRKGYFAVKFQLIDLLGVKFSAWAKLLKVVFRRDIPLKKDRLL
jgi:hypothetical protein